MKKILNDLRTYPVVYATLATLVFWGALLIFIGHAG